MTLKRSAMCAASQLPGRGPTDVDQKLPLHLHVNHKHDNDDDDHDDDDDDDESIKAGILPVSIKES